MGALVVILVAIVAEVVLLFLGRPKDEVTFVPEPDDEDGPHLGPGAGKDLLLRCSTCTNTYTAFDDGRRPLATLCPHCGQRGVVEAPTA